MASKAIIFIVVRIDNDVTLAEVQVGRPPVLVDEFQPTLLQEPSGREEKCAPSLWFHKFVQLTPRSLITSSLGHEVDVQRPSWPGERIEGLLNKFLRVRRRRPVD